MRNALGKQAHDSAVARRLRVELGDSTNAAAARPVLDNDIGIAGDVTLDVIGGEPRIEIIGAAGRMAEHNGHGLAAVELLDRLGGRGRESEP